MPRLLRKDTMRLTSVKGYELIVDDGLVVEALARFGKAAGSPEHV
jgi:hypothetical protein